MLIRYTEIISINSHNTKHCTLTILFLEKDGGESLLLFFLWCFVIPLIPLASVVPFAWNGSPAPYTWLCVLSVSPQMFHVIDMFPDHSMEKSIPLFDTPYLPYPALFTYLLITTIVNFICSGTHLVSIKPSMGCNSGSQDSHASEDTSKLHSMYMDEN